MAGDNLLDSIKKKRKRRRKKKKRKEMLLLPIRKRKRKKEQQQKINLVYLLNSFSPFGQIGGDSAVMRINDREIKLNLRNVNNKMWTHCSQLDKRAGLCHAESGAANPKYSQWAPQMAASFQSLRRGKIEHKKANYATPRNGSEQTWVVEVISLLKMINKNWQQVRHVFTESNFARTNASWYSPASNS
jgi:hypothetical protein